MRPGASRRRDESRRMSTSARTASPLAEPSRFAIVASPEVAARATAVRHRQWRSSPGPRRRRRSRSRSGPRPPPADGRRRSLEVQVSARPRPHRSERVRGRATPPSRDPRPAGSARQRRDGVGVCRRPPARRPRRPRRAPPRRSAPASRAVPTMRDRRGGRGRWPRSSEPSESVSSSARASSCGTGSSAIDPSARAAAALARGWSSASAAASVGIDRTIVEIRQVFESSGANRLVWILAPREAPYRRRRRSQSNPRREPPTPARRGSDPRASAGFDRTSRGRRSSSARRWFPVEQRRWRHPVARAAARRPADRRVVPARL